MNSTNQTTATLRAKAIYAYNERNFAASVAKYPISTKEGKARRAYAGVPLVDFTPEMIADVVGK